MPKIGIVLAGGASKGAYEIGCLRAIEDHFGIENIKCISSASVGSIIAQSYGTNRAENLAKRWKDIDTKRFGRFFLAYSGNDDFLDMLCEEILPGDQLPYEHYVSIWNFSQHKIEYVPYHKLSGKCLQKYIRGGIAIPFFSKGEVVKGDRIYDGAFLDNIPVYPLVDKDLDYIFCVYFDNFKYVFENEVFDKKVIKLFDFPNEGLLETMVFTRNEFEGMIQYGYDYTNRVIEELFVKDDKTSVLEAIEHREKNQVATYKPRLTTDVVLNNINVMTKRYSKRMSKRVKDKAASK